jgi:tetratricopeptide (TPR) repeat protein
MLHVSSCLFHSIRCNQCDNQGVIRRAAAAAVLVLLCSAHLIQVWAQDSAARAKQVYARALELEAKGNHTAALTLLWEASGLAPADADIQNRLGEALERIGALDAAADAYRRALAGRPGFRQASNNLILTLAKAGKGAEAVERARALAAESPGDPDRQFTLGLALSEQDVDQAIAAFTRALQLDPRHVLARYNLALVLRRVDRPADALRELERALAIDRRPEVLYTQGIIYWHQGDLGRAADALRAAIAAAPTYADAHHALGSVLKSGRDWSGAAASLRTAISLQPDLFSARYALAQVLTAAGDERGARSAIDDAERLRERTAREREALTWTAVGIRKGEEGNLPGAAEAFGRAIAAFEAYAPAHYQLGLAFQRLGRAEDARAAFERAQRLNPSLVPPVNR